MSSSFHEAIHQCRQRYLNQTANSNTRNYLNESYQEYEFLNMKIQMESLFNNLERVAKKVCTDLGQETNGLQHFENILKTPGHYATSLLSLCQDINQLLSQEPKIRISHCHYSSQSIFLGFYLRSLHPDKYITFLTTKANLKSWQRLVLDNNCVDSESELKKLLTKQKINVHTLEECFSNSVTRSDQILIIDLFNTEVIQYKPLLLKLQSFFSVPEKVVIYHSNSQDLQIQTVLGLIGTQFSVTEADLRYPIEIELIEKDTEIKKKLAQFLQQDSKHPQKQDIIIFYKNQHLNSTSTKFILKVKQLFNEKSIASQVQFITAKSQALLEGKNHIFIAQNSEQLYEWNYSYANVFYLIDYGWNTFFRMDYFTNTFTEGLQRCDLIQKSKRIAFIGASKVGRYIYKEHELSPLQSYLDRPSQIMSYVLNMISLKLTPFLETEHQRVQQCLKALLKIKAIQEIDGKYQITDEKIVKLSQMGIDPVQARIIMACLQKQKSTQLKTLSNLMLMTLSVLNARENLRKSKDSMTAKSVIKPKGVWRRTGYLDSCLEILTKAEIVEQRKNQSKSMSRRKTSKMNEGQAQMYGNHVSRKMAFQQMEMEDFLREYFVNTEALMKIHSNLSDLREIFEVEETIIRFQKQSLEQVLKVLMDFMPNSVATYSGMRRFGYYQKSQDNKRSSIFAYKDSLMMQLNQTPQHLLIMRCIEQQGKREILMGNSIECEQFGLPKELPSKKSENLNDQQIEFHGVSSSIFKGLFRNNGQLFILGRIEIQKFQKQNQCMVEPNQSLATIFIYTSKQAAQKVKEAFQELIKRIKEKFVNYNKIIHYLGNTNISMSNGGQIKEVIKDNYINKCYLNNIDLSATHQDLEELFEQFFVLKKIQLYEPQQGKNTKSALIEFNSQKDYYRFHSYYNQIQYFDQLLEVKPIVKEDTQNIEPQMYIDFKWYVWKSHRKAIIFYTTNQSCIAAYEALQTNSNLDGVPVTFSCDKNKITLQNLNPQIDQTFLQKYFSIYGQIKEVQILKTPLKEPVNQEGTLDYLLKQALKIQNLQNNQKYKIEGVEKHKNGLRKCKVTVKKVEDLRILIEKLNGVTGKIGQSRLYAQSIFTKSILVVYPSALNIYLELLEETISSITPKPNISHLVKDRGNSGVFIVLKGLMHNTVQFIAAQFQKKLTPFNIQLNQEQKKIILSQIGMDNLIDLEEQYNCKLVLNSMKKQLNVICKSNQLQQIKEQVALRVQEKFFYSISLNLRSYKNLQKDQQKLQEIKAKYSLDKLNLEEYSKTLIFQGSADSVQNALNYMMHLIESFSKSQQELINTEVCLICCEELSRPYRLQNCGHKFCFGCLDQCINSTLGDISLFPIKCPHCMIELTIDDLESLIDIESWDKLINVAANHFVNRNSESVTYCYTPGCKQINLLKLTYFRCDVCETIYCSLCQKKAHQGLTCEQARLGSDVLFKKYMQENGVRTCPNKTCKMPIVRTDGCYRVTCSRCNKSMCFKCEPKKMIAYENASDCYNHLNQAHGGYW